MHSKYIGLSCPDNPARVADYGTMPWERDIEPVMISDDEAARNVMAAIAGNSMSYGLSADALAEEITNLDYAELRDFVLAAMFPSAYPTQTGRARRRIFELCGRLANEYQEAA